MDDIFDLLSCAIGIAIIVTVIALGIVLLGVAIALAYLTIQVAVLSLPVIGIGAGVIASSLYVIRMSKLDSLKEQGLIAKMVEVCYERGELTCSMNESQIEEHSKARLAVLLSLLLGILAIGATSVGMCRVGVFRDLVWEYWGTKEFVPSEVGAVFAFVLSTVVTITIVILAKPTEAFKRSIRDEANRFIIPLSSSLSRSRDVIATEGTIKSVSHELGIIFPTDFSSRLERFIQIHGNEFLTDSSELVRLIDESLKEVKADAGRLQGASRRYEAAVQDYRDANNEVQLSGNISLIEFSDMLLAGLEGVKEFLPKRDWKKFDENLDYLIEQTGILLDNARKAKAGVEIDQEDPYSILGLSPDASKDEIKRAYRRMSNDYHPDRAMNTTDAVRKLAEEKWKEIKDAYDQIMAQT